MPWTHPNLIYPRPQFSCLQEALHAPLRALPRTIPGLWPPLIQNKSSLSKETDAPILPSKALLRARTCWLVANTCWPVAGWAKCGHSLSEALAGSWTPQFLSQLHHGWMTRPVWYLWPLWALKPVSLDSRCRLHPSPSRCALRQRLKQLREDNSPHLFPPSSDRASYADPSSGARASTAVLGKVQAEG